MRRSRTALGAGLWGPLVGLGAAALPSCAAPPGGSTAPAVTVVVDNADPSVNAVTVTATTVGVGRSVVAELAHTADQWQGAFGDLPPGSYTFHVVAQRAAGVSLDRDYLAALLEAGADTTVALNLGLPDSVPTPAPAPAPPPPNAPPTITSLVASGPNVVPGGAVSLAATASDADGDALTYAWTAPAGTFSPTNAASTVWTAPATEGNYTLRLTVRDGRASAATTYVVHVNATGTATVRVRLMSPPVINAFAVGAPDAAGTSSLVVTAVDPDGDAMTYSWSASCAGYFGADPTMHNTGSWPGATTRSTTFTATDLTLPCHFAVVVTDAAANYNTAALDRAPPAPSDTAPVIGPFFQSERRTGDSGVVVLRATVTDRDGTPVTLAWSASLGALGPARDVTAPGGAYTEELAWTAPGCFLPGAAAVITVTATDPQPASSTASLTVASACPTGGLCVAGRCELPRSCNQLHALAPAAATGSYPIDPDAAGPVAAFSAYCDMATDGGGWTLVLRNRNRTNFTDDLAVAGPVLPTSVAAKLASATINVLSGQAAGLPYELRLEGPVTSTLMRATEPFYVGQRSTANPTVQYDCDRDGVYERSRTWSSWTVERHGVESASWIRDWVNPGPDVCGTRGGANGGNVMQWWTAANQPTPGTGGSQGAIAASAAGFTRPGNVTVWVR